MIKGIESILIGSENPEGLAKFYREIVGLKQTMEFEMGENNEMGFGFEMSGRAGLFVYHHSGVKGKNSGPERIMVNLEVDDIKEEFERIKKAGAKVVSEVYHVEEYGLIATFADIDGNYFQIVQTQG